MLLGKLVLVQVVCRIEGTIAWFAVEGLVGTDLSTRFLVIELSGSRTASIEPILVSGSVFVSLELGAVRECLPAA